MTLAAHERSYLAPAELEDLVVRIEAFNNLWHALRDLGGQADLDPLQLAGLRDLKAVLQARLLREGGGVAYLARDTQTPTTEPLLSVRLRKPVAGRVDACHLPERVAWALFTPRELASFLELADGDR